MPELPEVETLKCYLAGHIIGETIASLETRRDKLRYELSPYLEQHAVLGVVSGIKRKAKFLIIELSNGYMLIFHLGMSGRLTMQSVDYQPQKHDHIIISFQSGDQLVFNDARRFGMVYSCRADMLSEQSFLNRAGREPLEEGFDACYLLKQLAAKKSPIKTAIMDNKIVVGVGNIYAAESLFMSKINPLTKANTLGAGAVSALVKSIKRVLQKAIYAGGTTLKDFLGGDSKPGYFKQELQVYGRKGLPCYICKTPIESLKQAGRATFFCPSCQQNKD